MIAAIERLTPTCPPEPASEGGAPAAPVLVAEDDRVMSEVIRFNLERAGYRVTVARNGTDAWNWLNAASFQALVTDYQMPGMTGEEVCRAMRDQLPHLQIPIIFLSARGLELNVDKMKRELGIETLLFKPFSPKELVEAVTTSLRFTAASGRRSPETPEI